MDEIKFSHQYDKLWGQDKGLLIRVDIVDVTTLAPELVEYDTRYLVGDTYEYYPLPVVGDVIVLTLLGNHRIPFTTIRSYTDEKYRYYNDGIGKWYRLVMTEV